MLFLVYGAMDYLLTHLMVATIVLKLNEIIRALNGW